MEHHEEKTPDCFAYFNILRFVGAFCIAVFYHYNDHLLPFLNIENPFQDHPLCWAISRNSYVFVEMYFIISGILFSVAYQKKIAGGGGTFDSFIIKRIIRIYPIMILTHIFMYIGNYLLFRYNGTLWSCGTLNFFDLLLSCLLGGRALFNLGPALNGPTWYIHVLMVCYVLAFFLTKLSKKLHSVLVFAAPVLLGLIIRYAGMSAPLLNVTMSRGLISFFEGILLAVIFRVISNGPRSRSVKVRAAALVGLMVLLKARLSASYTTFAGDVRFFYTFLVFPCLMLLLYDCRWVNRLCSGKIAKWLGNISFGMYLWNFPIYLALHILIVSGQIHMNVSSGWFIVLVALIHIVVASVSYEFIERRITGRLAKLADKAHILADMVYK